MQINIKLQRKEPRIDVSPCVVEKIVELPESQFRDFSDDLLHSYDFISDNLDCMYCEDNGT